MSAPEPHQGREPRGSDEVIAVALRRSLMVLAVLAALIGAGVWLWKRSPAPTTIVDTPPVRPVAVASPQSPRVPFTAVTSEAGIDFTHVNGAQGQKLLPETMGGGCAFLDVDGDGDQDVLFVGGAPWPWNAGAPARTAASIALYANDGAGRFTNITDRSGLGVTIYGMGAAVGDYDNDGLVDIFITAVGENKLFHNLGDGRFEDVTTRAGVGGAEDAWSTSAAFFDYDSDGRLDLFVCNYVAWSREIDLAQGFQLTGVGRAYGPPVSFAGTDCYLYRNHGDGTFTDVSEAAGVRVRNAESAAPVGKSLAVTVMDLDGDGFLDVVVANDTVRNFVFHHRGDGTFEEIGQRTGIAYDAAGAARGAMGIDAAAFGDDDRRLAVAIGNFANEMTAFYVARDGAMRFTDDAAPLGLGGPTRLALTFGLFFFDADLDGRLDLLAANGHVEDAIHQVQSSQHYRQPAQLFRQVADRGRTRFVELGEKELGVDFLTPIVGRGAAYADIDGDGDLDVLLIQVAGPPLLLRNDLALDHHWLRFKLIGSEDNRDAIGARVVVRRGDQTMSRQVMPARSYLSQVELPVTIGLGDDPDVDEVTVIWPNGDHQIVDQYVTDGLTIVNQR